MKSLIARKRKKFFVAILMILLLLVFGDIKAPTADPGPFNPFDIPNVNPIDPGIGQFLFYGDHNLSLVDAQVKINLWIEEGTYSDIYYSFDGNYTILNPDNSLSLAICAPFDYSFWRYGVNLTLSINTLNLTISINETEISNILDRGTYLWEYHELYNISTYLFPLIPTQVYTTERIFLVVEDIVFPENSSTQLRYKIDSIFPREKSTEDAEVLLYYDLYTASGWNGNINESVEFIIEGLQPFEYYTFNEMMGQEDVDPEIVDLNSSETYYRDRWVSTSCYISNIGNATSYKWYWENQRIIDNWVYVKFLFPKHMGTQLLYIARNIGIVILFSTPVTFPVAVCLLIRFEKRRRLL